MKNKKITLLFLLLGFGFSIRAQQANTASGGNATGNGGSVSYSIGQTGYTVSLGNGGSVTEGVQQPYEIFAVAGQGNPNINAELVVYPNPTTDLIMLSIKNYDLTGFNFQLFDATGKMIEQRKVAGITEIIRMQTLPAAAYFLKVTQYGQTIKTFKIIKN